MNEKEGQRIGEKNKQRKIEKDGQSEPFKPEAWENTIGVCAVWTKNYREASGLAPTCPSTRANGTINGITNGTTNG